MKRSSLFTLVLLAPLLFTAPAFGQGDQPALNVAQSMADNLRRLAAAGKPVEIVLRNGKSYRGKLAAVGDHSVVVAEIQGREFYDGLVLIDEIVAVEVRARER
jgi:hypothetical protein